MSDTPVIVNPQGQPARPKSDNCPRCGKGKEFRRVSQTFGDEYELCRNCGHEFREAK